MANDDLLQQVDQLMQKRLEANNNQLEQNFQKRLAENNKQLCLEVREDIKAEVDPLHERLDAQREQITSVEKNLSKQISREVGDLSDLIGDPIIPKLDQHEDHLARHDTDIAELQKAVDLKPRQH